MYGLQCTGSGNLQHCFRLAIARYSKRKRMVAYLHNIFNCLRGVKRERDGKREGHVEMEQASYFCYFLYMSKLETLKECGLRWMAESFSFCDPKMMP